VIFVESDKQALRVRSESESSVIFRVRVMIWSSQSRVTKIVESLRVIGLQARVNVESHETSRFFYDIFCHEMAHGQLENGTQHVIKWRLICYKMVSNVVLTSLIAGSPLYLSFLSVYFTCLFHS